MNPTPTQPVPGWSGRRATDALTRLKANGQRNRTPCGRCGQPIDYQLAYPDPMSCSVGHIKSRHTHPHLTWDPTNWQPEHLVCNERAPKPNNVRTQLGITSGW